MEDEALIAEIVTLAADCEVFGAVFDNPPLQSMMTRLREAISDAAAAWSGSWIGYHGRVYLEGLRRHGSDFVFDVDYGLQQEYFSRTRGPWCLYEHQEVLDLITEHAGIAGMQALSPLEEASKQALKHLQQAKGELLPLLDALLAEQEDNTLRRTFEEIDKLQEFVSPDTFASTKMPKRFQSRDQLATSQMTQAIPIPPHI